MEDIGEIVTSKVGCTTPNSKCFDLVAGATNYACVKEEYGFKRTRECVPGASKDPFSIQTPIV